MQLEEFVDRYSGVGYSSTEVATLLVECDVELDTNESACVHRLLEAEEDFDEFLDTIGFELD